MNGALATVGAGGRAADSSAAGGAPLLLAQGIGKTYDEDSPRAHTVIADVSFALAPGEIVSVVGPSGCGKTTLLNLICGLIPLSAGRVLWRGKPLDGMPARVGYMLQKDLLLPWRTALGNVTIGLELQGVPRSECEARAHRMLDVVGLAKFHDFYPSALSGGMRQRVALARTLVTDPEVLLLDEPFAALDFQTKLLLEADMLRLVRSVGRAVLVITHDVEEAVSLSDQVVVLSHRPTRIRSTHPVGLAARADGDLLAVREAPGFRDHVRTIWSELEVRATDG